MQLSRKIQLALICASATLLVLALYLFATYGRGFGMLTRSEMRFRDFLYAHGRQNVPEPGLIYVGIDNDSVSIEKVDLDSLFADVPRDSADFRALSLMAHQWPWPREIYSLMLDKLFAAGARVVVLDLLFPKATDDDPIFKAALDRHRESVVLGSNFVPPTVSDGGAWELTLPVETVIPQTAPLDPRVAYVNFWPDHADEKIRRARFRLTMERLRGFRPNPNSEVYVSLAARALMAAGLAERIPRGIDEDWLFRYTARPKEGFRPLSAYQLFAPRYWQANFLDGERVRGKIVVIGPSGNWQHDEHETPLGEMPGPEIHLNVMNALLHGAFLHVAPPWVDLLLIVMGGAIAWLISLFAPRPALQVLRGIGVNVIGVLLTFVAYDQFNSLTAVVLPLLACNLGGGGCFVYEFIVERFDKARTRRTLERYVSKDVVRELLDNRQSVLHAMGGSRRQTSVLFSDLRGFTSLTESADAVALVTQLNEYFQHMVRIVFANAGTLDKFIGDGLMAHWGSIVSDGPSGDAQHAVRTALQMRSALARLNEVWKERGWPTLDFGIGINAGEVIVGNLGCEEKMEVSVIGDPVNLAARIEGATKQYHVDLLIGESVAELLGDGFILRTVDELRVKGKSRAVRVLTVLGERKSEEAPPAWLTLYEEAVRCYRQRAFQRTIDLCSEAGQLQPDDWLIKEYLSRAQIYAVAPPGPEWSGVAVLKQK